MKRGVGLTVIATLVICGGVFAAIYLDRGTLASKTVNVGGETIHLQLYQKDGSVYAASTAKSTGSSSVLLVGESDKIGSSDPLIVEDLLHDRVLMKVGSATVVYDTKLNSLAANP